MSLKLKQECDFSLFFLRNCQILTMMLQEFNFPTISLHSMMKQVKLTNFILGFQFIAGTELLPCQGGMNSLYRS